MKKIKLITSLSVLGTVGATIPFVSTSCSVEQPQEVKQIINNDSISNYHVIATQRTQPGDIVGTLGIRLLNKFGYELSQREKDITYDIDLTNKPDWLKDCSIDQKGEISMEVDETKVSETITPFITKWTATCDGITSKPNTINLWYTPDLEQNGMIICVEPYTSYEAIKLPEEITRTYLLNLTKLTYNCITFDDFYKKTRIINVKDIVYFSIVKTTEEQSEDVYMLYDNFGQGWENLTYVNLTGLVGIDTIGKYVFADCKSLLEINMTGANKLRLFCDGAFSNCASLQTVDFSDVGKNQDRLIIQSNVLSRCTSLKTINISSFKNNTLIYDAFAYNCPNLKEIIIGDQDPTTWDLQYGSTYTFANEDAYCDSVNYGIKITGNGSNEAKFKSVLPQESDMWDDIYRIYK